MILSQLHLKVIEVLKLNQRNTSPKGWIVGGQCPFCGSDEKFGIKLNEPTAKYPTEISFNCYRGSCGQKGSEYKLLPALGLEALLKKSSSTDYTKKAENVIKLHQDQLHELEQDEINIVAKRKPLPLGFKRIFWHQYLGDRGFESWQFECYMIGTSTLSYLKDYVVFLIFEDGENKGFVARSTKSSDWIENYNAEIKIKNKTLAKEDRLPMHLRYINEGAIDFDRLLFGIDQVTSFTIIVILVEGVTDKANVDRWLNANDLDQQIVCLCTFGKKCSVAQMTKITMKIPNLQTVIFMYDPDAINQMKERGQAFLQLKSNLEVKCCFLSDKDPGELSFEEFDQVYENAETVNLFALNRVQVKNL
jgi:hypothetical protein